MNLNGEKEFYWWRQSDPEVDSQHFQRPPAWKKKAQSPEKKVCVHKPNHFAGKPSKVVDLRAPFQTFWTPHVSPLHCTRPSLGRRCGVLLNLVVCARVCASFDVTGSKRHPFPLFVRVQTMKNGGGPNILVSFFLGGGVMKRLK